MPSPAVAKNLLTAKKNWSSVKPSLPPPPQPFLPNKTLFPYLNQQLHLLQQTDQFVKVPGTLEKSLEKFAAQLPGAATSDPSPVQPAATAKPQSPAAPKETAKTPKSESHFDVAKSFLNHAKTYIVETAKEIAVPRMVTLPEIGNGLGLFLSTEDISAKAKQLLPSYVTCLLKDASKLPFAATDDPDALARTAEILHGQTYFQVQNYLQRLDLQNPFLRRPDDSPLSFFDAAQLMATAGAMLLSASCVQEQDSKNKNLLQLHLKQIADGAPAMPFTAQLGLFAAQAVAKVQGHSEAAANLQQFIGVMQKLPPSYVAKLPYSPASISQFSPEKMLAKLDLEPPKEFLNWEQDVMSQGQLPNLIFKVEPAIAMASSINTLEKLQQFFEQGASNALRPYRGSFANLPEAQRITLLVGLRNLYHHTFGSLVVGVRETSARTIAGALSFGVNLATCPATREGQINSIRQYLLGFGITRTYYEANYHSLLTGMSDQQLAAVAGMIPLLNAIRSGTAYYSPMQFQQQFGFNLLLTPSQIQQLGSSEKSELQTAIQSAFNTVARPSHGQMIALGLISRQAFLAMHPPPPSLSPAGQLAFIRNVGLTEQQLESRFGFDVELLGQIIAGDRQDTQGHLAALTRAYETLHEEHLSRAGQAARIAAYCSALGISDQQFNQRFGTSVGAATPAQIQTLAPEVVSHIYDLLREESLQLWAGFLQAQFFGWVPGELSFATEISQLLPSLGENSGLQQLSYSQLQTAIELLGQGDGAPHISGARSQLRQIGREAQPYVQLVQTVRAQGVLADGYPPDSVLEGLINTGGDHWTIDPLAFNNLMIPWQQRAAAIRSLVNSYLLQVNSQLGISAPESNSNDPPYETLLNHYQAQNSHNGLVPPHFVTALRRLFEQALE